MLFTAVLLIPLVVLLLLTLSWGPGIHIQLARRLTANMPDRLLDEQVELLEHHEDSFQYGCIAADIINLKKYGGLNNHCHNWNIKERLEVLIDTEAERAFLYGYLCHLAADVVAHNHFVPYHLVYDLPPQLLGHTYWEARADSFVDEKTWVIIDGLRTHRELRDNDEIIRQAVPRKALSMASNRFIFDHILLARSKKAWREVMDKMRRRNPVGIVQRPFLERCLDACLENMFEVFDVWGLAVLRHRDPNGHLPLKEARRLRRSLVSTYGGRRRASRPAREVAEKTYGL